MSLGYHFVAHTRWGFRGVVAPSSARWLWRSLREVHPTAFAASLMPDHVHLSDPYDDVDAFARVLERHGRRFGARWDVGPVQTANTRTIFRRTLRYIILNPVRDGWVPDPWRWPWSTLRDLSGAVVDPWTPIAPIAGLAEDDPASLLAFVSSDSGTTPRIPTQRGASWVPDLESIAAAVAAALRGHPGDIRRRGPARNLFVQLAFDCGAPRPAELASWCGATVQTVRNARALPNLAALHAARLSLSDERLRIHDVDTRTRPCAPLHALECNTRVVG